MAEWIQRGSVLTAADAAAGDAFGSTAALSSDGAILAVGAPAWEGTGTNRGGVYIYDWSGTAWAPRGSVLEAADAADSDAFGSAVALSSNGVILAVGAPAWENTGTDRGGVYTYDWSGSAWVQRSGVLEVVDAANLDAFGASVALSADGSVLVVGAPGWEQIGTDRGGVYTFDWNTEFSIWIQRSGVLEVVDAANSDAFGSAVALSSDGTVLVVGAPGWEGAATDQGAVYTFDWNTEFSIWIQRDNPLEAADAASADLFGHEVALSGDAAVLVVGARDWDGAATDQGGVYTFDWSGAAWVQRGAVLEAADSAADDEFASVAISRDAAVLVVGAPAWEGAGADQGGLYVFDFSTAAGPPIIPLRLLSDITTSAVSVGLRLLTYAPTAPQTVPLVLQSPSAAHFTAAAARWTVAVVLDGATVAAAQIVGAIEIAAEEDASSTCALSVLPAAGVVDPRVYEGQPLTVWFAGLSTAGAELYRVRRFAGVVETAEYDPDAGTLRLSASTDLQGTLERADRATVDTLLPGSLWSEHVFDADADSYQYARDRISTLPSEMHIDEGGAFRLVAWAAKATADITYTDAGRFGDTLRLRRAARRDLITRVKVDLDFRYVRLRQRNLTVQLVPRTLCDYLDNGYELPSRETVRAAADGGAWTRVSAIQYAALPGPIAAVCTPQRAWAGGADDFCLGASWTAGRRWAQTVTEEYVITVVAGDLEEAVGTLPDAAAYGIEAVYDATDYETMRDFSTAPVGSVFDPAVDDYTAEATAAERTGRTAMALAQRTAIAAARARILSRARGTTVEFEGVYRPDLSLDKTLAVDSPYLACRGKCAAYSETLDLGTGALRQQVTIALSRHDGSGLVVDDPVEEAAAPTLPAETSTGRYYALTFRLGGTIQSPADNEDWDGWMTNVSPLIQPPGANLYRTRLVVRMPEIEDAARNATTAPQADTHAVAVPQDPLTLSA